MHDVPCTVYEPTRRLVELPQDAIDVRALDRLVEEYPDTCLGAHYGEWDAGLLYRLPRKGSDLYKQFARNFRMPCGREELAQNFYDYCCPPSGIAVLYNNLRCPKKINWIQGSTHGYVPPESDCQRFSLAEHFNGD